MAKDTETQKATYSLSNSLQFAYFLYSKVSTLSEKDLFILS